MKHIVILGAGYAGIYALRELVKKRDIKITLIDKHTYHNLQPEVYDLIANKSNIADVTIDLTTLCYGFEHDYLEYRNLRVTDLDLNLNKIFTQEQEIVQYDYLVLAVGTRTFFPKSIDGLKNTDDIKKLHRAIFFKQSFENQLFNKISDEAKKCDNTHIVIVGAGLSGVEISAEMACNAKKFFKRGNFACNSLKISLVTSSNTILPGFDEQMVNMSYDRLNSLGINIITNVKMQSSDKEFIYLSDDTKIRYSFIIFTGGVEASNIASKLDINKNEKNQIIVDEYLQPEKYKNIFACGDVAVIKNNDGKIMPQNVTVARASGVIVGKNILNLLNNKELKQCHPKLEGTLIALGGKYAVCDLYGIVKVKGFIGWFIKQYVFFRYKLSLLSIIKNGYAKLNKQG